MLCVNNDATVESHFTLRYVVITVSVTLINKVWFLPLKLEPKHSKTNVETQTLSCSLKDVKSYSRSQRNKQYSDILLSRLSVCFVLRCDLCLSLRVLQVWPTPQFGPPVSPSWVRRSPRLWGRRLRGSCRAFTSGWAAAVEPWWEECLSTTLVRHDIHIIIYGPVSCLILTWS